MIRAHAAAVVEAVRAEFADTYDADEVPAVPGYPYIVVYPDNGRASSYRWAGGAAAKAWRVVTLYVGSTADEGRIVAEKAYSALEGQRLVIAGRLCTPVREESSRPVEPDPDGRTDDGLILYSGSTVWTFGSSPTAA